MISTKHVDDVKVLGEPAYVKKYKQLVESHFGECVENVTEFTCVGIHHVFSEDGVALDQTVVGGKREEAGPGRGRGLECTRVVAWGRWHG